MVEEVDFRRLINKFRQFGGLRLIWEYTKIGVLPVIFKGFFQCLAKGISFKVIYPEVLRKIEPILIKKYETVLQCKKEIKSKELKHEHPKVIWWCWLQGIDAPPPIVRACYNSLKLHLTDYEIIAIDNKNWKEYVALPDYVVKKWEKGRIPAANFSDLLRLELLVNYGGTWIDSTVLCTGFDTQMTQNTQTFLDSDLFVFQYTPQGTTEGISISSWFISAHSNHKILVAVRDMMLAYWKDYDCLLDYYLIHLFFSMAAKEYPEEIAPMPYGYSMNSLVLLHHWGEVFDQKKWDKLTEKVCFHKLSFRTNEYVKHYKDDYYNWVISKYTS